jgi:hypothetical protein
MVAPHAAENQRRRCANVPEALVASRRRSQLIGREAPRVTVALNDEVRRNPEALSAAIDGEVVALDVARGVCYGLDSIGARIWEILEFPVSVQAICTMLCAEYDVELETCRKDVLDLLGELLVENLILISSPPMRDA